MGLLPGSAGAAAVLIARPEHGTGMLWLMAGLAAAAGLWSLLASYREALARARARGLETECRDLAQRCSLYLARARAAEGNVESLALIREIHRTGNVADRAERFRGLLTVVARASDAAEAQIFVPEGTQALPALAAALRQLADGEFFVYLDKPVPAGGPDAVELVCRRVSEELRGERRLIRGEVCAGEDARGFAELNLAGRERPRREGPTARQLLEAQLGAVDFEPSGAGEALEHRQVFRVHDQAGASLTVSYPLMAEGVITGAMRLRLPAETLGRRELAEIEEILQETAGHVGLVVKKEEDVERAKRDGLTGLLLKAEMFRDVREELAKTAGSRGRLALLMVDIDHFKRVNDTYGHPTGDTVLKAVAGCLAEHVRSCDRAYRYGGEEMTVLLPGADEAAAGRTAERLRRAVAALEPVAEDGRTVPVTISLGVTDLGTGAPPADVDELIARADQALYFSKQSGRDRTSVWRPAGPVALPRGRTARAVRPAGGKRRPATAESSRR
jgi:diguanylate cyclase (GGDEF)-like protein